MNFSMDLLSRIQDTTILTSAQSVQFHRLGGGIFELVIDGKSFLLSAEAGLDLSCRLADYVELMEQS